MKFPILASMVLALTAGSGASQTAEIPRGCRAMLTVEKDSCLATSFFDCGDTITEITYREGNQRELRTTNKDWAYIRIRTLDGRPNSMEFDASTGPKTSLASLRETGETSLKRRVNVDGKNGPFQGWAIGNLKLTGRTKTVSGIRLIRATEKSAYYRSNLESTSTASVYLFEEMDLRIDGTFKLQYVDGEAKKYREDPRALHLPGSARFLTTHSRFGCEND